MFRAVIILAALLATTAAHGQESTHYKTWPESLRQKATELQPGWSTAAVRPAPIGKPERIVIKYGGGGLVSEHIERFDNYRRAGNEVEIRGSCYSACTLITGFVPWQKLCFSEDAFLAFHAVRTLQGEAMPLGTSAFYQQLSPDIRSWIDRTGGWQNLPLDGFWFLRAPELWEMGYPRCKP